MATSLNRAFSLVNPHFRVATKPPVSDHAAMGKDTPASGSRKALEALRRSMDEGGISNRKLVSELKKKGIDITEQAVGAWFKRWQVSSNNLLAAQAIVRSLLGVDEKIRAYDVRGVDGADGIDADREVMIEEVDVKLSGGPGAWIPEFIETKYKLPFQLAWFKRVGAKPSKCKLFRVRGHSMEPLLFNNDSALVNLADTDIVSDHVYAIAVGGEARVKRLFKIADGVRIVSENPDKDRYPDETLRGDDVAQLLILGRVINKMGSGGL